MGNPPPIFDLLVECAVNAVVLIVIAFLLSRFLRDIVGRSLLVIVLFIGALVSLVYVVFAVREGESAFWVVAELVQVGIFVTMGLLGRRGSPWWLVAGWALHSPLWNGMLHYFGPGRPFAPINYMLGCFSFDLVVAVYIVIAYGLLGVADQRSEATLLSRSVL